MTYTCVRVEGGLFSGDFLDCIHERDGQKPKDFGLEKKVSLVEEIQSAWTDAQAYWEAFKRRLSRKTTESLTTITREQWVIPLLEILGYELSFLKKAPEVAGRRYQISHCAGSNGEGPPVHIVHFYSPLGERPSSGRGNISPHALLQEYLNATEHLWGVITNGKFLRLLRDSSYFSRPAYVEFDFESIFDGNLFNEFVILYRLVHRTRLPKGIDDAHQCLLERYHQDAIVQGERIREDLRGAVEVALKNLAAGFLSHPRNDALRKAVESGMLSARDFYRELLYLIYRILFLFVSEERGLIGGKRFPSERKDFYSDFLSLSRLRKLAENPPAAQKRFSDLYLSMRTLFRLLHQAELSEELGLPPLNGELFAPLEYLDEAYLSNGDLLASISALSYFTPKEEKVFRRVNYAALDVEELGSVYESLLDYQPVIRFYGSTPTFDFEEGLERKTTGSYYTRPELVKELIDSALQPVIDEKLEQAGNSPERKEEALLSIKVCDPACGSGHFLLAAARRLGVNLARVRTESDEPSPEEIRRAVRDCITHCVYGVDKNPLAVDLCKVALWIEGHSRDKPLTFLDHRIRCGDSLVGVFDLGVLKEGIPDGAFAPVAGDEHDIAKRFKNINRKEREAHQSGQLLFPISPEYEKEALAQEWKTHFVAPDETPEQVRQKREAFMRFRDKGTRFYRDQNACNMWTGAFFTELTRENIEEMRVPTTGDIASYLEDDSSLDARLPAYACKLQYQYRFFHWPLEFPDVFESGGFDVVLCNPPWERIKLQEKEFFRTRDPEIASARNKAVRKERINNLPNTNPALYKEYQHALHYAGALSKFLRSSGRFNLTGRGDINTYSVFAELFLLLINPRGRAGILIPTGIATDDTNKRFFSHLVGSGKLVSLFDFENREAIFPSIHRSYKFSLLTIRGKPDPKAPPPRFAFFLTRTSHLQDDHRLFNLSPGDFSTLNPNTRTCPVFRTRQDAELTKYIYKKVPVLENKATGENPWGVSFLCMFHMANDSHLFRTRSQLEREGYRLFGNRFIKGADIWLPLYEAKMIWHYDHRFGTYEGVKSRSNTQLPTPTPDQHADPSFVAHPWYWVSEKQVQSRTQNWNHRWFIGFRNITNTTNERTVISSIMGRTAVGHSAPLILPNLSAPKVLILLANLNSIVLDNSARNKVGGTDITHFYIRQFPILRPDLDNKSDLLFIMSKVIELVYSAWDIKPFADDVWRDADESLRAAIRSQWEENKAATGGHEWSPPEWAEISDDGIPLPPFKWDEDRRAHLRAKLDAYYAKLYGLTRKQLRYILDPADLTEKELSDILDPEEEIDDPLNEEAYLRRSQSSTFPGETFRVLKQKELKTYGFYRTRHLILQSWEELDNTNR